MLVGQFAQPCQKAGGRNADAPFALDRLDQMAAVSSSISFFTAVQIAERSVDEAGHQRAQAFVILRLGRGGRRRLACGRESRRERDDLVAFLRRVQPGQLDGRFVGLGARVAEERLAAEAPLR